MKWSRVLCSIELALAQLLVTAICCGAAGLDNNYGTAPSNIEHYLGRLVAAYPTVVDHFDSRFLYMKNGTRYPISDGNTHKTFSELLARPDIDDMFYANYPAGEAPTQPGKNVDPGRVRFTPLFVAMYGDCKKRRGRKSASHDKVASPARRTIRSSYPSKRCRSGFGGRIRRDRSACTQHRYICDSSCWHLQVSFCCRDKQPVDACLWCCCRFERQAVELLEMARPSSASGMAKQNSVRDREDFREARFHLGRSLVPLRHHAL